VARPGYRRARSPSSKLEPATTPRRTQQHLDQRVTTALDTGYSSAWIPVAVQAGLTPRTDPHWPALAEHLAALSRAGANAPALLRAAAHQRGPRTVLRSKSPDLVLQEIWGHLCCHYAIRCLMADAATHAGHDPDRVSFVAALRITRETIAQPGAFPP